MVFEDIEETFKYLEKLKAIGTEPKTREPMGLY
jgi:hypothetical protein